MKSLLVWPTLLVLATAPIMVAPAMASQVGGDETTPPLRLDTPSGMPVPRFVSLKAPKTYCRAGPTFSHPVRITFVRRGVPVMVVAETHDHWRKVRDREGDECWIHKSKLSGVETALITEEGLALHSRPDPASRKIAQFGKGLIALVEDVRGDWVQLSAGGEKGWARRSGVWGSPLVRQ